MEDALTAQQRSSGAVDRRWSLVEMTREWRGRLGELLAVFKLRIVALLVLASLGGAFLAAPGMPPAAPMAVLIAAGASASAGASALNQYLERKSDAAMRRTRNRPLVRGRLGDGRWVLWLGLVMIAVPVLAVAPWNPALAGFLAAGAIIYVGVYTLWLKPRTALNIVIGGAAGSAAVLSGGAAVRAWSEPTVLILAALVFLWTPSHFWSLSLLYRKDYQRSGHPMLSARARPGTAAWWILLHTLATVGAGLALAAFDQLGWVYSLVAVLAGGHYVWRNIQLLADPEPARARSLFLTSNLYLALILLAVYVDSALGLLVAYLAA